MKKSLEKSQIQIRVRHLQKVSEPDPDSERYIWLKTYLPYEICMIFNCLELLTVSFSSCDKKSKYVLKKDV
jgi:hypothetical protein